MGASIIFNLQGALQAAVKMAGAASQHVCAKYVRTYLEHGGINTSGRPGLARQYTTYLPTIGYSHIASIGNTDAQTAFTNSGARPGDIAVYQKPGEPMAPGHICMWTGSQWVSDFRQNHMSVYRSRGNVNAHIFRFTGEINNHPIDLTDLPDGSMGGPQSLNDLNKENLLAQCPPDINFKGMWMRYTLKAGARSPIMRNFMGGASSEFADSGWSGEMSELAGSDAVEKAMQLIAHEECGVDYSAPLKEDFKKGYKLDGEKYKTYGWGQMYNWNGTAVLQDIKSYWTEPELRDEFRKMVTREVSQVKATGLPFTDNQIAVLSHRLHFGPGAFNYVISKIKSLGRIPTPDEYRHIALSYCQSCSNWNLYGKGWTNGVNREASYWGT